MFFTYCFEVLVDAMSCVIYDVIERYRETICNVNARSLEKRLTVVWQFSSLAPDLPTWGPWASDFVEALTNMFTNY